MLFNPTSANPPQMEAPPVVISLFSAFSVQVNGQPIVSFRSAKARGLLAYLLLTHPYPVLRATLLDLFWFAEFDFAYGVALGEDTLALAQAHGLVCEQALALCRINIKEIKHHENSIAPTPSPSGRAVADEYLCLNLPDNGRQCAF